jgi:hypothetical protein
LEIWDEPVVLQRPRARDVRGKKTGTPGSGMPVVGPGVSEGREDRVLGEGVVMGYAHS